MNASGLLAGIFERKDFQLEKAEATALADAVNGVSRHYTWLSGVSERGQDWFNLFMITGVIVGARWHNPNTPSKTPAQSGTVVQFPQKSVVSTATATVPPSNVPVATTSVAPDTSPTNAINLTMNDLYAVEIPQGDGPVQ